MSKRTTAKDWEIIMQSEEGAIVNVDYVCPWCGYKTGDTFLVDAGAVSCLDGSWESDRVCGNKK